MKGKLGLVSLENGLFEDATKNAETSIRTIVESSIPNGYTVEFTNSQ